MNFFNGRYYIYPTTNEGTGGQDFHAFSSADLTNWRDDGVVFDVGPNCSWADFNGWAPSVVARNGKYYFYYSAEVKIGVAVGDTPIGPFIDKGSALISTDPYTVDIIDPHVFVDDNGQAYIYYGGSNGSKLVARKLNADMVSLTADAPVNITPQNFTEGPYMVKRNGTYYMTYSNGSWTNASYNVQYATGTSPLGPWTYRGSVLSSDVQNQGAGHHSITRIPGCDEYYITYHRYQNNDFSMRYVAIDRLYFAADGSIQQVNMTNYGVSPRVPGGNCPVGNVVSGGVYKLTHKGTNQCLDVASNSAAPGTNVAQYTDNGNDAQRWVATMEADGNYKLTHKGTNQCLDVAGNSLSAGANVQQYTDNGVDGQRWRLEAKTGGYHKLTHKGTNQCLDVVDNSAAAGTNVQQYTNNNNDAQRWKLDLMALPIVSGGTYRLTHKGTTQCLEVPGNSAAPGTAITQYTDNGNDAQRWVITLETDGYYKIRHRNTTQCLEVAGNSTAVGATIQQYTDNGNDAQRWRIVSLGDGYVKLVHKGTTHCIDVDNNLSNPGTGVHQYTDNGNDAQRWKLDLMPVPLNSGRSVLAAGEPAAKATPLQVYPVPASGQVHCLITPPQTGRLVLDLYDGQGRLVRHLLEGAGTQGLSRDYVLEGGSLPSGVYTLQLTTTGQITHAKLVIVH
ncbi:hypothetical protein BEN47_18765 [Hymenobacter lapidarius]|uniref:Ricin B lectin domain-containing protein n=2 Tax=Hymenobacter lapidarius TaxID=1908237 RepID=A0A1G1SU47_9BACT|nr:hypothetical protein BEN47_18765 [Hymenobacter lapidarius]